MTREDAAREIKSRFAEYLKPANKKGYVCPLCGNGTGSTGDGMSIDPKSDGTRLKCFKCGFYGDIVDLYQAEHGCSQGEAFSGLYQYFNITVDGDHRRNDLASRHRNGENDPGNINRRQEQKSRPEAAQSPTTAPKDYSQYYSLCNARISDPAAVSYLMARGISVDTAADYGVGFDPAADPANNPGGTGESRFPCPRIIIPTAKDHYVGRSIDPTTEKQYTKMNPRNVQAGIFNEAAIWNSTGAPVFIVEGAFDALSIIEAGGEAVALNSTSNDRKLLERLKAKRTGNPIILCLDNDQAGAKAAAKLADGLRELNISFISEDICEGQKDPNAALVANRDRFVHCVGSAIRRTTQPDNAADYISRFMVGEIQSFIKDASRKTGFTNLDDAAGGIYAGLYAVGGLSSLGKTTFCHQMADQMAAAGQHVLFFSMEQSRLEMVSKSIARTTAQRDIEKAATSLEIRKGNLTPAVLDAADAYMNTVGNRLSVIEGNFNCTVSFIGEYTRRYIEQNHVQPVVIVDYLQVLQADKDPDTGRKTNDTKQIVDQNVVALKRMTRSLNIPIFVISSVNRSNYLAPIDFESFKESGNIEYTADVVWGLQLSVLREDDIFNQQQKIKEKREKVREAKAENPRRIDLVCLKNRYGRDYTTNFLYYPQHDLFKPDGRTPLARAVQKANKQKAKKM